jgi:acetyl esterase/lipase
LVLWIHGGAWTQGTRADNIGNVLSILSGKGFAVASIEYRFSQTAKWPAQLQDCKGAVRWLRANAHKYGLDAAHFGAWGESAGAHLAAMLGTAGGVTSFAAEGRLLDMEGSVGNYADQSSRVQAVVDYYGPTDFFRSNTGGPFNFDVKSPGFPPALLIGGVVGDHPGLCAAASPLTFVDKDDPPFLILHGISDADVQPAQSRFLDSALMKASVPSRLLTFQGVGHGGSVFWSIPTGKQVSDFLGLHLKPSTALRHPGTGAGVTRAVRAPRDASGRSSGAGRPASRRYFNPPQDSPPLQTGMTDLE